MREDIEKTIRYVDASLSMEGMPLTESDKESIRACLSGETSTDAAVRKIIDEYKTDDGV